MPRRPHALVPLALAGLLAGCAGGSTTAGSASDAPGPTNPASPTTPTGGTASDAAATTAAPGCTVPADPVPTTGPAADAFGAEPVRAAYAFAADWLAASTFTAAPLTEPQPPQSAFAAAEAGLTPRARDSFRVLTAKLASTTEVLTPQDNADLISLASYGLTFERPGFTVRDPAYRDVACGPATSEVFERPGQPTALVLRFPIGGTFLLADGTGAPLTFGWRKEMGLTLVTTDDPARPWLVDGRRADLSLDGPKPDPAP